MECNAFGVGAIGHIVRLRDNGPSGIPFGRIGYTVRMHRVTSVGCSIDWVASTNHVNIKLVFTPKALHSKAQGRRASGAPWVYNAARNPNPNGVLQMRDAAYQSFVRHEYRHARRAIVQPRWGNGIAVQRVPRGTRRGREPRAMECNAFGVGAIGHIVRLRNDGPFGCVSHQSGNHPDNLKTCAENAVP